MKQKYPKDTEVYTFYYDWNTAELNSELLTVYGYEYMDGMQWNVTDEYTLFKEYFIPFFKFFKKKKTTFVRLPGILINPDKVVAEIKFHHYVLERFGHDEEKHRAYDPKTKLIDVIVNSKKKLNILTEKYPEKVIKAFGDVIKPDEDNFNIWR